MSGGTFDYLERRFEWDIIDPIKELISKNGKEKSPTELYRYHNDKEWYEQYPEDKFHKKYSDETIKEFQKAVKYLTLARIYTTRIDYLIAGDDGEENFHKRLRKELEDYEKSTI